MKRWTRVAAALAMSLAALGTGGALAHGGGHGGARVGVGLYIGAPLFYPWYSPWYSSWYSPWYYPPAYYYPPVVSTPSPPPVRIERSEAKAAPAESGYWYYCAKSKSYYPYVRKCPAGWKRVAPRPSPG